MTIRASRCGSCSRTIIPPRSTCPYCGLSAKKMDEVDLNDKGTILSFTILRMPPKNFEPPVLLALVEVDNLAVSLCLGSSSEIEVMEIGAPVSVREDEEGRLLFRLLSE